ncbi:UNVERIFIED_CONTAM: hypothetical protein K2H54_038365, partial [Gekko kuhli]
MPKTHPPAARVREGPLSDIPAGETLAMLIKMPTLQQVGWVGTVSSAMATLLPGRPPEPRLPKEMPLEKGITLTAREDAGGRWTGAGNVGER